MTAETIADLDAVRAAAARRRSAEQYLDGTIRDLRGHMRRARQAGYTTTEIGHAAGLSRQRVNLATKD